MRARIIETVLACTWVAPAAMADWSTATKVNRLNIGANSLYGTFVSLVGYSFAGCTESGAALIEGTNPNYKELISSLLAAKMADHDVQVQYLGCSGGYPVLKEVALP